MRARHHIQDDYPDIPDHIARKIDILWGSAEAMENYFENLMTTERIGRQGFPDGVFKQLIEIRDEHRERFGGHEVGVFDFAL